VKEVMEKINWIVFHEEAVPDNVTQLPRDLLEIAKQAEQEEELPRRTARLFWTRARLPLVCLSTTLTISD
jgi:hypothetical protein